jgi:hypothetical protein
VSATEPSDESSSGRRQYETPRVVDLGTVAELTRGTHTGNVHDTLIISL